MAKPEADSRKPRFLRLAFSFLDGQFRALEADFAMGTVAEGLVHRTSAAAEGKSCLAGEVELIAVDID